MHMLHIISRAQELVCRGHKVAVKFFPQAAEDFELMVNVLQGLNAEVS